MAIIGKIRDKGRYLLVGFVGLALLTFILTGLFNNNGDTGNRGVFGTIDGEEIDTAILNEKTRQFVMSDMQSFAQQQREYTERDREQSEDKGWNLAVDEILLSREYEALGMTVSENEFQAYLYGTDGFSLMQEIQQAFSDPTTGQFNAAKLDKYIQDQNNSTDPKVIEQWKNTKEAIRKQRLQEKYFQYLKQGTYVTKLEAKNEYLAKNEVKSVSFVLGNYRDILDKDVKISDKEIRDFYERNKEKPKYQQMAGRDVRYFDVTIEPSRKDSAEFNKTMKELKANFAKSTDDSVFILMNSELPRMYAKGHRMTFKPANDPKAQQGMTYPAEMDTIFRTAAVGTIVGPYNDNGKTRIAKILDFNTKSLTARHILIAAPKGDTKKIAAAKKKADSILTVINSNNFEAFVTKFTEDPGSKDKGGKYEDFLDYEMVEPFANYASTAPIGKIGVVQTDFGFHIMEVLGRKDVKYPVMAVVEKTLNPSLETNQQLKDKADNLLIKIDRKLSKLDDAAAKINMFDTIAREEGYYARPVRMFDEAPKVQGFTTRNAADAILQLAFAEDAEVGMLCASPIQDEKRIIIAMVSSIREKGVPNLEDVYAQMRTDALNEKKAEMIKKKIGSVTNLEVLAKKLKTQVSQADITFTTPSIQGGGFEPEVVGALFSGKVKDGQSSKAIVGNAGVYVFRVVKTSKAPAATNYDAEKLQLVSQMKGSVMNYARQALQKKFNVRDNRALVQAGIYRD